MMPVYYRYILAIPFQCLLSAAFVTTSPKGYRIPLPNICDSKNVKTTIRTNNGLKSKSSSDSGDEFVVPPKDQLVSDTPIDQRGIGVGIDLGTTNSCAAVLKKGIPSIIQIPDNGSTIPSVVSLLSTSHDECLVGKAAIENEVDAPLSTYRHVKRIMGMGGQTAAINVEVVPNLFFKSASQRRKGKSLSKQKSNNSAQPSLTTQLKDAEENPALLVCRMSEEDDEISYVKPEEISSKILSTLIKTVEEATQERVTRAVIGVPAYFNDIQREATLKACELAGVSKARLLREPEAAALAYGIGKKQLDQEDDDELVLVFDLGGGTFDVSILEVGGGITEVLATSGNNMLGGSDFDGRIAEFLSKKLAKQAQKINDSLVGKKNFFKQEGGKVKDVMVRCAEAIRIYLSNQRTVTLNLPLTENGWLAMESASDVIVSPSDIVDDNDDPFTFQITMTRKEMETLCIDEFQALLRPVREVAVMAQALLPGDARPDLVEAAIRMEEEIEEAMNAENSDQFDFEDFFSDEESSTVRNEINTEEDEIDPKILSQMRAEDINARKREQQGGRKRARKLAAEGKKYRNQRRKADEEAQIKLLKSGASGAKGGNVRIRDGIHGRPISTVILVGGATRMPAIGRLLAAITGTVPQKTVNPDEAVALGCAVQVGILDGDENLDGLQVLTPIQAAVMRAMARKRGMNVNL